MPASLRNVDRTDRELLAQIDSLAGDEGATSTEIGISLGFSANGKRTESPAVKVGSRLQWMRHYGFIERVDEGKEACWRLTVAGKDLKGGRITKAVEQALNRMDPGSQVLMMRELTRKAYVEADAPLAFAVRREYQHNAAKRKR